MDEWARNRVTEWRDEPFDGGITGLRSLADDTFTGAIEAGHLLVMMLNGRVIGHWGGELDSISSTGTVYQAPDPSLPLLFTMLEADGTEEGHYYTEQTSLTSVHDSLVSAGFAGYLVLSEHVLSGDYYIVYYGDKAMPVAFIGTSQRRVTGDEAFELAADEVGLYEVRSVDLEVIDLPSAPEPSEPDDDTAQDEEDEADPTVGGALAVEEGEAGEHDEPTEEEVQSELTDTTGASHPTETVEEDVSTDEPTDDATEDSTETPSVDDTPAEGDDHEEAGEVPVDETQAEMVDQAVQSEQATDEVASEANDEADDAAATVDERAPSSDGDEVDDDLETEDLESAHEEADTALHRGIEITAADDDPSDVSLSPSEVAALEQERDELLTRVHELEMTREELESTLDEVTTEQTHLLDTVETLRAELDRLEQAEASATEPVASERSIPTEEALTKTHLFVRYRTNDNATLDGIGERSISREAFLENLILEGHTEFDTDTVGIDGLPFEQFLEDCLETRFARWLVEEFPFKIANSSERSGLINLFDGLRSLDRVDFYTQIDAVDEHRFDVVARDRVGRPLLVADVDPGRQATSVDAIRELVTASSELAKANDSFVGAFLVTESFFESDVIGAADEATSKGLLSRSDKQSFVHVSRGVGYHLCLIEHRSDAVHVTKPAL